MCMPKAAEGWRPGLGALHGGAGAAKILRPDMLCLPSVQTPESAMPPKPLIDLDEIDFSRVEAGPDEIRRHNPQRHEMEQLDRICHLDLDEGTIVGLKDVGEEEFWVRGHIPGRPLLPGVLMCEAAAQLCSYYFNEAMESEKFLAFGGLNDVKFRRPVAPGSRLVLVAKADRLSLRRATFRCQGFVDGKMVFQGTVIGMPM